MSTIRTALHATIALACGLASQQGLAQANAPFPTKPIRFISPAVPGAGNDTTTRAIAQRLTQIWGQQVIVDNRAGAAGLIALDSLTKAVPDGHTLVMITSSLPINTAVNANWPYDASRDMKPVSQVTSLFYIVYAHPSVPVATFKELVAYGRAQPGKLNYGTPGTGGIQHLGWEIICQTTGAKFTHVPYKSGAPAITATIAGEMQIGFATLLSLRPHITSGRARMLAVTSRQRVPTLPDIATVAELGLPGYEIDQWYGVVTGVKVPPAIVNKLNAAIVDAVKSPDVAQRLMADGSTPVGSSIEQFSAYLKAETAKWRKVVKEIGLVLQ